MNELDIVMTADGRTGVIVLVYPDEQAFEVEFAFGVVETIYRENIIC